MVEGMVMELFKNHVIVMTKSGEFLKLKKHGNVNIGDIYKGNIYRRTPVFNYAAAAILIFVLTSLAGYTAYAHQIVGYVDIKGSKAVRLYINRKGTVQKVDGLQNGNKIKNLPVNKAVEELSTIAPSEGIYSNDSEVDISTTKVKDSKLDLNKVNEDVKKILSKDNKTDIKNKPQPGKLQKMNPPNSSVKGNSNVIEHSKDTGINNDKNNYDDNNVKGNQSKQNNKNIGNDKAKYKNKK